MAKQTMARDARGNYRRDVGWERVGDEWRQHRFYVGKDRVQAALRVARLDQTWDCICKAWQRDHDTPRPQWDTETLPIGLAVARGEEEIALDVPQEVSEPADAILWLSQMRKDFPHLRLVLADAAVQAQGEAYWESRQKELEQKKEEITEEAQKELAKWAGRTGVGGQTLYQALDAYAEHVKRTKVGVDGRVTPYGKKVAEELATLKKHTTDTPLALFGLTQIEDIILHWKHRPRTRKGKPCAVETARHMIKRLREFIKWLHKAKEWHWRKPADYEVEPVRIAQTAEEISSKVSAHQVKTYTVEELATLFRYATPRERVLMLLALNCGFGRAELVSLQKGDIFLDHEHPHYHGLKGNFIKRVRVKTHVYGEWLLWGETVAGIKWYLSQRPAGAGSALLVTKEGKPLSEQTRGNNRNNKIPSMWARLLDRVGKDHEAFAVGGSRRLSFNKLRKTAINLIRKVADGEIAGIFACHGTPVRSDALLDLYSNRHFDKVFNATSAVRALLEPMFRVVPEPFPTGKAARPSIALSKLQRIGELRAQGWQVQKIADELGISRGAVRYYLNGRSNTAPKEQHQGAENQGQGA